MKPWSPWTGKSMLRRELALADRLLDERNATIAALQHMVASADSLIERMNTRSDKLLAKIYELQDAIRAGQPVVADDLTRFTEAVGVLPVVAHQGIAVAPECFDAWADGREPCPACWTLLTQNTDTPPGRKTVA